MEGAKNLIYLVRVPENPDGLTSARIKMFNKTLYRRVYEQETKPPEVVYNRNRSFDPVYAKHNWLIRVKHKDKLRKGMINAVDEKTLDIILSDGTKLLGLRYNPEGKEPDLYEEKKTKKA